MLLRKKSPLSPSTADAAVKEALKLLARRGFMQRTLTLGGMSLLSGCSITDEPGVEAALKRMSRFNDGVQAFLFDPARLAPVDGAGFRLDVGGLVTDKRKWTLAELNALPQTD